jgi:hypothetical protein
MYLLPVGPIPLIERLPVAIPVCTYSGISIPITTPQVEQWFEQYLPISGIVESGSSDWVGRDAAALPTAGEPFFDPIRLGVLYWPTGATRYAYFHTVINSSKLDEIRATFGSSSVTKTLQLGDDVSVPMYMLPARRLAHVESKEEDHLYLLTLVDKRFLSAVETGQHLQHSSQSHFTLRYARQQPWYNPHPRRNLQQLSTAGQ